MYFFVRFAWKSVFFSPLRAVRLVWDFTPKPLWIATFFRSEVLRLYSAQTGLYRTCIGLFFRHWFALKIQQWLKSALSLSCTDSLRKTKSPIWNLYIFFCKFFVKFRLLLFLNFSFLFFVLVGHNIYLDWGFNSFYKLTTILRKSDRGFWEKL